MSVSNRVAAACASCGKPFESQATATDRQLQCSACGQMTLLCALPSADPLDTNDAYDLAEESVEQMPAGNVPPISAREVLAHLGHADVSRKRVEPDPAELAAE